MNRCSLTVVCGSASGPPAPPACLPAWLVQEHKQVVADALELVEFGAGEAVFGQGEAADRFYLLREGTGGWAGCACACAGWWWWWWCRCGRGTARPGEAAKWLPFPAAT